ncbi:MAG: glycosyltransferase [Desulfurococcaceae archaeon]
MPSLFNILIYHHVTKGMTGTNIFLIQFLKALDRSRFNVKLLIYGEVDSKLMTQLKKHANEIEYWHLPFLSRTFSTFLKLIMGFLIELLVIRKFRYSNKFHLIISTNPFVIPIFPNIAYVHYPSFNYEAFLSQYSTFTLTNRIINMLYGTLITIFMLLFNKVTLAFFGRHAKNVLYLTNSKYTAKIIKLYCRRRSVVVHPPVNVKMHSKACSNDKLRAPYVITISRFAHEKKLHVIPIIAKLVKLPVSFIILGTLKGRMGQEVKDAIEKLCRSLSVEDKVKMLPNLNDESKIEILCSSKIYLHTMPNEHFGITVVEAMASGLPVIVPDDGGPYEDIIDFGKYGLAYHSPKHAAELIEALLSDEKLWKYYSELSRTRALEYDFNIFKAKINKVLSLYLSIYVSKCNTGEVGCASTLRSSSP